jgi:hypothetical protein
MSQAAAHVITMFAVKSSHYAVQELLGSYTAQVQVGALVVPQNV